MKTMRMETKKQRMHEQKERNTGFSLVELIVVIAIMAILAIVIAPQVMKYIGKSRTSVDAANMNLYKTAATTALAEESVYAEVAKQTSDVVVTIKKDSTGTSVVTCTPAITVFTDELDEILNATYPLPKEPNKNYFKITIDVTSGKVGKITVESLANAVTP